MVELFNLVNFYAAVVLFLTHLKFNQSSVMNESEPSDDHLHMLRKYFGHNQFRPMQWKIIHSLLEVINDNFISNYSSLYSHPLLVSRKNKITAS